MEKEEYRWYWLSDWKKYTREDFETLVKQKGDEFDPPITLYRGTTGSESNLDRPLFLTDKVNVAKTYVKIMDKLSDIKSLNLAYLNYSKKASSPLNWTSWHDRETKY
ncbi:MAG: hypothetical protein HC880_19145 [Bacteroidia bacterium]|nr:hypothetical protein [Bacteroidia bacterium]